MTPLHALLPSSELEVLAPLVRGPLSLFPIVGPPHLRSQTLPFDSCLGVVVKEIPGSGRVREVAVHNNTDHNVLLLDGDAVVGGQQDRIVDGSCVVHARRQARVQVCCVEQGRWDGRRNGTPFDAGTYRAPLSLQRLKRTATDHDAGLPQLRVWEAVDAAMHATQTLTSTSCLSDVFASRGADVDSLTGDIEALPSQLGVVIAIGDRIEGVDLFGAPATYRAVHARLLRSYALDTFGAEPGCVSLAEAERFLMRVLAAKVAPGDLDRAASLLANPRRLVGAALLHEGSLVHVGAQMPTYRTLIDIEGLEAPRTSETHPLAVAWLELPQAAGRLGVSMAPGRCGGRRRWQRSLRDDLVRLRHAHRADTLICLLEDAELTALGIPDYIEEARSAGFLLLRASDTSHDDAVAEAKRQLQAGARVVAFAEGALGRAARLATTTAAACGANRSDASTQLERTYRRLVS